MSPPTTKDPVRELEIFSEIGLHRERYKQELSRELLRSRRDLNPKALSTRLVQEPLYKRPSRLSRLPESY